MEHDHYLPPIDAVEIADLRDVQANRVSETMKESESAPCVRVTGEDAQEIARLWRELPRGQQMRCHLPHWGLRFYGDGALILEASLCWRCHNIFIDQNGQNLHYEFDADHAISQQLLALLKRIHNAA